MGIRKSTKELDARTIPWQSHNEEQNSELLRGVIPPITLEFSELGPESRGREVAGLGCGYSQGC